MTQCYACTALNGPMLCLARAGEGFQGHCGQFHAWRPPAALKRHLCKSPPHTPSSTQLATGEFGSAPPPFFFLFSLPIFFSPYLIDTSHPPRTLQVTLAACKPVSSSFLQCPAVMLISCARLNLKITPDTISLCCRRRT